MKSIRPIYDGLDDLDNLESIDHVDMMVCLFSQINERIDAMDDIDEEQKNVLRHMSGIESLPLGVISSEKGINDGGKDIDIREEFDSYRGTEFDELIVMFELTRWLEENKYKWDSVVSAKYQYTARALGIFSDKGNYMVGAYSKDDYILNVERNAFNELRLMLPLHWATILLDWYPVSINGIGNKEMIEYGNLTIVCSEKGKELTNNE